MIKTDDEIKQEQDYIDELSPEAIKNIILDRRGKTRRLADLHFISELLDFFNIDKRVGVTFNGFREGKKTT